VSSDPYGIVVMSIASLVDFLRLSLAVPSKFEKYFF
jgi:hypothetical protein